MDKTGNCVELVNRRTAEFHPIGATTRAAATRWFSVGHSARPL
ncbi:hypothetical protein QFZ63_005076 [Streptomyces sp. B3I7]|nr:hypothetical protein [Streptomyces sp. B3I8]MDQ0813362.1 hypothetical protein [Streptomyces sp. B3I7]